MYTVSQKTGTLLFLRLLCVFLPILKIFGNIAAKEICNKTHISNLKISNFIIDAWYLIVTQAENTPSTATVDLNITQQNPTLKLVLLNSKWTQSTVKDDQIRCSKCRPLAFTQAYQLKIWHPRRMMGNDVPAFVREFGATHSLQQWVFANDASSNISTSNLTKDTVYRRVMNSCLSRHLTCGSVTLWWQLVHLPGSKSI